MKNTIVITKIILIYLISISASIAQENQGERQKNGEIIEDGIYFIVAPVTKQRLFSVEEVGNVKMTDPQNNQNQQWAFKHIIDNIYTIQNIKTKGFLEVPHATCEDQQSVKTWMSGSEAHQRWEVSVKNNQFVLKPTHCLERAMDRNFGAIDADAIIFEFGNGDNENQYWNITPINQPIAGTIVLHPNPAKEIVNITGLTFEPTPVKLVDNLGKIVVQKIMDRNNNRLNISLVERGIYHLITGKEEITPLVKI
ncbi:RICIN domain-containing protein [Aquimarina sp. RZ0]|uniref:RICIN domain-containing protein n=1 Tax=Aquimarina sp. RZ0 TaxID=2607730 RepID=UPI0011F2CDE0|nr:RICIN domain-containing protein [Aquimarina sp. RZ0]KAA1242498.1 RICIN domain-containing protein [Aquimarina sp. RZ0]